MRYKVPRLPLELQVDIADTLSVLDARIAENRKINHHLANASRKKRENKGCCGLQKQ